MGHAIPGTNIKLQRAYEPPTGADGKRVLIDRLWPRGVKKTQAKIDEWMKDIAPSTALRKWFGHEPCPLVRVSGSLRAGGASTPRAARSLAYDGT